MERSPKPSKKTKTVSFDTKVHGVNFARKSTLSRQGSHRHRISTKFTRRMILKLTKIDITGYKLPSEGNSSDDSECARTIPVEDILSCSRTNPVKLDGRNQASKLPKTNQAAKSSRFILDEKGMQIAVMNSQSVRFHTKKRKRLHQKSMEFQMPTLACMETMFPSEAEMNSEAEKPPCKKNKTIEEGLDLGTTSVIDCVSGNNASSITAKKSAEDFQYASMLNQTIKKITGHEKKKKKKNKSRSVLLW